MMDKDTQRAVRTDVAKRVLIGLIMRVSWEEAPPNNDEWILDQCRLALKFGRAFVLAVQELEDKDT